MTSRADELSRLCRACGACCNGAMFAYVELDPGELAPETRKRLQVIEEKNGFEQPCAAHGPTGCGAYDDRPSRCRSYACQLYRSHERDGEDLEDKLARVGKIRALTERLYQRSDNPRAWLPRAIESLVAGERSQIDAELMLDVAELAMRLRRDLGWKPE